MTEQVAGPRGLATRLVILLMLVLVGASLLAPDTVDTWADTRDAGWGRTVARAWADPVGDLSRRLSMDVPLRRVERLVDGERGGAVPAAVPGGPARPGQDAPSTTRAPRTADADRPLRILAVGDSLMLDLQYGMERDLGRRPDVVVEAPGVLVEALGEALAGVDARWETAEVLAFRRLVSQRSDEVVIVVQDDGGLVFGRSAPDGVEVRCHDDRIVELLAPRPVVTP